MIYWLFFVFSCGELLKTPRRRSKKRKWLKRKKKEAEDAADVIKEYDEILRIKSKGIRSVAYHRVKVFNPFREKEKFVRLVTSFKITTQ